MVTANGKVLTLQKLQEDRLRCECDEMNYYYFQIFLLLFILLFILLLLPT